MTDILLDIETADVKTDKGDFVVGKSDGQHQEHLLVFQKGALKDEPETGVGIENYLNDDDVDGMLREVRTQFEQDGMTVSYVAFDEVLKNLNYNAQYKS